MEKARIKATGEIVRIGFKDGLVEAFCTTLSGYASLTEDQEVAEAIVQKYHDAGDDDEVFEDNEWVTPYIFQEEIDDEELVEKYGQWNLVTEWDGCFYCTDNDYLYEDAIYAKGAFEDEDDNLFYFCYDTGKFYTPAEIELFEE